MPQTGYTPIQIYSSSTPTNAPSAGNLTNDTKGSELAINIADKNLFFKDSSNVVNTVPIRQSGAASDGWLSSTDWNTFNNKQPAGTYVTSVTGTAPVVSSGGTTPAISMAAATTSVNGYLTSTDWNTFNGKQAALVSGTNIKTVSGTTLLGSGDLGTIGTGYGGTGLTSFTANGILFASSTSALATGSALTFDGTNFATTGRATAASFVPSGSTVPTNGVYLDTANSVSIAANSAQTLTVRPGGIMGVGITPQSWYFPGSVTSVQQVGANTITLSLFGNQSHFGSNFYLKTGTGADSYINNGIAMRYRQDGGSHVFESASSGTAGNSITWSSLTQIFPSGGVSIGNTTDPGATNLSVTGTVETGSDVGIGGTPNTASSRLFVKSAGSTSATNVILGRNSADVNQFSVRSDGAGFINAAAWVYGSDATTKENIEYLTPQDCLSLILKAKPAKFDYIDGQKHNFGYIAQDVQEWLPESVSETPNGKLGLQDGFINALGTGAIQALHQQIEKQQAIIADLLAKIEKANF